MKQAHWSLLVAGMLALAPQGARAQPPARELKLTQTYSTAEAETRLEKFADCTLANRARRTNARAFVRMISDSPEFRDAGIKLADGKCLTDYHLGQLSALQLVIKNVTFRAALFGALFRIDYGKAAPLDFAELPPLSWSKEFDGPIDQLTPVFRGKRALGDCIVRAVPGNVRDLLYTAPESDAEAAQFAAIVPAMQGCLTVDQKVSLSKYDLRGILAEAIYKLELARAGSAPAPKRGTKG